MKKWLTKELICPECLEQEIPLNLESREEKEDDILEGSLNCPQCGRSYTIKQGIAVVVPEETLPITRETKGYGSFSMLSSYLWSHYSEFFNGPDATDAYQKWADAFRHYEGWALDIGCSVGRLTFELTKTHDRVVGIDTSLAFISAARQLSFEKHLEFEMIMEGRITETKSAPLPSEFDFAKTEFMVADATALPFRRNHFATTSSVNILEKVSKPGLHLAEANRVMQKEKAQFLFSDPFSWDESISSPDRWLGGRNQGPFKGYGMDNIRRLLQDEKGPFSPGFDIRQTGQVLWKIRKTRHLWEHITSQFVIGQR
jgi:SAM-dependent methyltransferase/uncharacterized protein YbaR (Trm112 family)